jgi:hypothetical protein
MADCGQHFNGYLSLAQFCAEEITMKIEENCPEFQNYIKENYSYYPWTGKIFNNITNNEVGNILQKNECNNNYLRVKILGKMFMAHRVAWFLYYGKFPEDMIDHISNDGTDNRIYNLRAVCNRENQYNIKSRKIKPDAGFHNVYYHKRDNLYVVKFRINGKLTYKGSFKNIEDAADRAEIVRNQQYGEFKGRAYD